MPLLLFSILHPRRASKRESERTSELSRTRDGRRRIVLPILPSSMTLGDDHREGANVLLPPRCSPPSPPPLPPALPPAGFPAFSPCLSPFALRRPMRCSSFFNLLLLFLLLFFFLLFLLLLLPSSLPRLPPVSLRSSYHNRRHPSCITCHFVPRRSLSRAAARQSRNSSGEPTMTLASRRDISPGVIAGLFRRN